MSGHDQTTDRAAAGAARGESAATASAHDPGLVRVRLAGFGGQGLIKAGEILGAAATRQGRRALQSESYGSSARGGLCTSDVTLATGAIYELEPETFDVLIVLSQDSANAFCELLRPDGLLIYEEDLVSLPQGHPGRAHAIPATRIATQDLGRGIVTNMVVLGFATAVAHLVDRPHLEETITTHVPRGTEELNLRAFGLGWERGAPSA